MASGKLSPRQKMINLMYLVFIAMLALNMSKEVLSAFGLMNEKLTDANVAATERNNAFMANLATKASDEPEQYASVNRKAIEVSSISSELDTYLESIKSAMIATIKEDDRADYEVQDKPDFLDQRFFVGDKLKAEGQEYIDAIDKYRNGMIAVLTDSSLAKVQGIEDIKKSINANFNTNQVVRRDGKKIDWLNYNYEGVPLVASTTKLTQLQADIKTTKSELLSKLLAGQQTAALSFDNYSTLMETTKSAYYSGERFEGAIVLGRTDASTVPKRVELTLDGRKLTEEQYSLVGGKVVLNIGTGAPGDHKIEGFLYYGEGGEETEVEVKSSFATISAPNSATISADKMNVVYRGVKNPMTISMDGVSNNNVRATAQGLTRGSGSSYIMDVTTVKGREVTINVTGTIGGKSFPSKKTFRIKDIPRPTGTIRGEDGNGGPVRMQRQGLEISSVGAMLFDFDFDLKLNVSAFSFKVAGQPTVKISGSKLNSQAKNALKRAKRGETVQIFDIKAKIAGNSAYKLPRISPVFVELTN